MKAARLPIEVYAFVEDEWHQVLAVGTEETQIALQFGDQIKLFPAQDSFKWDLLLPPLDPNYKS